MSSTAGAAAGSVPSAAATALADSLTSSLGLVNLGTMAAMLLALVAALLAPVLLDGNDPVVEAFRPAPLPLLGRVDDRVLTVDLAPDGRRLVTAGGMWDQPLGHLTLWDITERRALVELRGIPATRTAVFSPDGRLLATGDFGGAIKVRDADTAREIAAAKGYVNSIAFAPDGASIVTAGLDDLSCAAGRSRSCACCRS